MYRAAAVGRPVRWATLPAVAVSPIAGSDEQLVSRGKQIIHLAVVMSPTTSVDSSLLLFMNLVGIESLFKIADSSSVICLYFSMLVLMEQG